MKARRRRGLSPRHRAASWRRRFRRADQPELDATAERESRPSRWSARLHRLVLDSDRNHDDECFQLSEHRLGRLRRPTTTGCARRTRRETRPTRTRRARRRRASCLLRRAASRRPRSRRARSTWAGRTIRATRRGFKVERATSSGGPWTQIGNVGPSAASFSDTSVAASTTYYYRVRATSAAGDSGYSNTATATTPAAAA